MRIEEREVGSGITRHKQQKVCGETSEEMREAMSQFAEAVNRSFDWREYTSEDIAILKKALDEAEQRAGPNHPGWKPHEDREWYWLRMITQHKIASDHFAKGNASAAMCAAARYGSYRAVHDLKFAWEDFALQGEKMQQNREESIQARRKGTSAERIAAVEALRDDGHSYRNAFRLVGKREGSSAKTIETDYYKNRPKRDD